MKNSFQNSKSCITSDSVFVIEAGQWNLKISLLNFIWIWSTNTLEPSVSSLVNFTILVSPSSCPRHSFYRIWRVLKFQLMIIGSSILEFEDPQTDEVDDEYLPAVVNLNVVLR